MNPMKKISPRPLLSAVACGLALLQLASCKPSTGPTSSTPQVSRSLALSADGAALWVVNTESDSISQIDVASRTLRRELLLGASAPAPDLVTQRYDPAVRPRAITLVDRLGKAYVAGQAANAVIVVDTGAGRVLSRVPVGAEPTAVVASADGNRVYVVNHQSATVQAIDTRTDTVVATRPVGEHPFGASLSADGRRLYVSHLLLHPGVTIVSAPDLASASFTPLPDQPPDPTNNKRLPNGEVRGAYAAVPRPETGEVWVPHLLLATGTPQPELVFDATVFPTVSVVAANGNSMEKRLLFRPVSIPTASGSFIDSVSGPRDVAFTPDGRLALVAMAQSEDVMVFDAATGFEATLVRPTPSALIEGVIVDAQGTHAYLQGRSTHNVTVLSIAEGTSGPQVRVDGDPIECLQADPMPPDLRRGLRLFYSANSAAFPITQDFWVACSTCHLEGGTDAVTWRFQQGPRDTPSNAGGPINTGFLFRQAVRDSVLDYDETIRVEQGGNYHRTDPRQLPDLQAIAQFTNYAIPFPQNPYRNTDGTLTPAQTRGQTLFTARCAACHTGDYSTDSGSGNPQLDLSGTIVLHDIGTCVTTGPFPDQPATDIAGHPREACLFDTPTLRGIFATAPYFHDGSAETLEDVIPRVPNTSDLTAAERSDLLEYLKSL
jgi:YVTN family beta-propeller protein